DQGVCSPDLLHGISHCRFSVWGIQALSGYMVRDHLRVDGRLEDRTGIFQFLSQFQRVDKISVVRDSERPLYIVDDKGLRVLHTGPSCGGLADMTYSQVSSQFENCLLVKHLIDMPKPFPGNDLPLSESIRHCHPTALLPPVLQCKK